MYSLKIIRYMYSLEGSYLEIVLTKVLMSERTSSLMQIGAPAVKLQPTRWTPHVIVNFISHLYRYISVYIYIQRSRMGQKNCIAHKSFQGQVFLANRFLKRPVAAPRLLSPPFRQRYCGKRMILSRLGESP